MPEVIAYSDIADQPSNLIGFDQIQPVLTARGMTEADSVHVKSPHGDIELAPQVPAQPEAPRGYFNPKTGTYTHPGPMGTGGVVDSPYVLGRGVVGLAKSAANKDGPGAIASLNDIADGVFGITTPLIGIAAVGAPLKTAMALAKAGIAAHVGMKAAEAVGASPEMQRLTGNIAAVLSGTASLSGAVEKMRFDAQSVLQRAKAFDIASAEAAPAAKSVGRGQTAAAAANESMPAPEALPAAPEQATLPAAPDRLALPPAPEQAAPPAAPEQQALPAAPERRALGPAPEPIPLDAIAEAVATPPAPSEAIPLEHIAGPVEPPAEPVATRTTPPTPYRNEIRHVTTPEGKAGILANGYDITKTGGIGGDHYGPGIYASDAVHDGASFWRSELETKNEAGRVRTEVLRGQVGLEHPLVFEDIKPGRFGGALERREVVARYMRDKVGRFDDLVSGGMSANRALGAVARETGFDGLVMQRMGGDEIVAFHPSSVQFDNATSRPATLPQGVDAEAAPPPDAAPPAADAAPRDHLARPQVDESGPPPAESGADRTRRRRREARLRAQERVDSEQADRSTTLDTLVAKATQNGYQGDPRTLHAELNSRLDAIKEIDQELADAGRDPAHLVKEIRRRGGISIGKETGYKGELRWLKEHFKDQGSGVQSMSGVVRVGKDDGLTLDDMLTELKQDPKFNHIRSMDDLIDELRTASSARKNDQALHERLAKSLGEKWWEQVHPTGAEPSAGHDVTDAEVNDAMEFVHGDISFDPAEFDTLDTGEQQARLPEAGSVRDQNIQTPAFEAPFSLSGEADTTPKGAEQDLFAAPSERAAADEPAKQVVKDVTIAPKVGALLKFSEIPRQARVTIAKFGTDLPGVVFRGEDGRNRVRLDKSDVVVHAGRATIVELPDRAIDPHETDDDVSWRAYAANGSRVAENPQAASEKDLRRAIGYQDKMRYSYVRRLQKEGRTPDPSVLAGYDHEMQWYTRLANEKAAAPVATAATPAKSNASVTYNEGRKAVEVSFDAKPDAAVIAKLKAEGFRWAKSTTRWYRRELAHTTKLDALEQTLNQPTTDAKADNPFRVKAERAQQQYDRAMGVSAHDQGMAESFPLGGGFARKGAAKRIDASVSQAVNAESLRITAKILTAKANAFDAGEINKQGRSITKEKR